MVRTKTYFYFATFCGAKLQINNKYGDNNELCGAFNHNP